MHRGPPHRTPHPAREPTRRRVGSRQLPLLPPPVRRATAADIPALARDARARLPRRPGALVGVPERAPAARARGALLRRPPAPAAAPRGRVDDRRAATARRSGRRPASGTRRCAQTLDFLPATFAGRAVHRLPIVLPGLARIDARHPRDAAHVPQRARHRSVGAGPRHRLRAARAGAAPVRRGRRRPRTSRARRSATSPSTRATASACARSSTLPRGPRMWLMWREPR